MLEVEVKYRASLDLVRGRLLAAGARLLESKVEEDVYLGHPCRDFASTDEALRVRLSSGGVELTYKGPRAAEVKTRREVSVAVEGDVLALLASLGFREVARVRKRREYYALGHFTVSLDAVEGLGEFVEIEALASDGEAAARLAAEARGLAAGLGLVEEVRETYLELLLKRI